MSRAEKVGDRRAKLSTRVVSAMTNFRSKYPVETSELDSAVEAADGYRELHGRLAGDDLPRFQQQFKTYLNQNTIREIAQFQAQLNRQSDLIRQRIDTINTSLVDVDYNPGRYIRLEPQQTPNIEIRDFRTDLRACTDNAVSSGHRRRPVLRTEVPAGQADHRAVQGPRGTDRRGPEVDAAGYRRAELVHLHRLRAVPRRR